MAEGTQTAIIIELRVDLDSMFHDMRVRDRMILKMRYGLDGDGAKSAAEVAKEFGISRPRVHQIQNRAIRKLRKPYCAHQLRGYLQDLNG